MKELKSQLAGYEMVVASANNGAVENITDEVPSLRAVAAEWRDEAGYLADQAAIMLGGAEDPGTIRAAWQNLFLTVPVASTTFATSNTSASA